MNLFSFTIQEAIDGLGKKTFSVTNLVKSCIDRVEKLNKKLNVFIELNIDNALKKAKEYDDILAKEGKEIFTKKPLLGIPIGIKDLYTTEGLRTTAGSKIIDNYVPPFDSTVVKKLKDAGAIIIGKTNEDAWGHGSSGENSDHGPTKNPYDLERVPGGSSSGSAVAVATGQCLMANGTDTGSSVRLPAAFCNLVGLKPSYGRVSRYGVIAMASSFDTMGHLTRTVYDNAKVLEITAGQDPYDATSVPKIVEPYTQYLNESIKGLKIGIPKEYFVEGMDPKIEKITREAIKTMENLGGVIKDVSLPHTEYAMACYYILVPSEISSNLSKFDGIRYGKERETFGAEAKRRIILGTYTLSSGYYDAYYLKAAKVRNLIKQDFDEVFKNVDIILAPTSPTLPFKIGEKADDPLQMYISDIFVCPINIAGVPSLNVPCGFVGHLPVGLQIIGPQFTEKLLYQVGSAYEKETQFYKISPKL